MAVVVRMNGGVAVVVVMDGTVGLGVAVAAGVVAGMRIEEEAVVVVAVVAGVVLAMIGEVVEPVGVVIEVASSTMVDVVVVDMIGGAAVPAAADGMRELAVATRTGEVKTARTGGAVVAAVRQRVGVAVAVEKSTGGVNHSLCRLKNALSIQSATVRLSIMVSICTGKSALVYMRQHDQLNHREPQKDAQLVIPHRHSTRLTPDTSKRGKTRLKVTSTIFSHSLPYTSHTELFIFACSTTHCTLTFCTVHHYTKPYPGRAHV